METLHQIIFNRSLPKWVLIKDLLPKWVASGGAGTRYLFPSNPGGERPMNTRIARREGLV